MFTKPLFGFNPTSTMLVVIAKDKDGKLFKLRWSFIRDCDRRQMLELVRVHGATPLYLYKITPKFHEVRLAA